MKKIDLQTGYSEERSTNGLAFTQSNKTIYRFDTDLEQFDTMIEWLYANTTERFNFLGTSMIYFENDVDAAFFKLTWFGD